MEKLPVRILGLDCSPLRCGRAVVTDGRVGSFDVLVRGKSVASDDAWALAVVDAVPQFTPDRVVVEYPGASGPNVRTLCRLHYLCGSLVMALHMRKFDVHVVDVGEWTRMTGGKCLRKDERVAIVAAAVPSYDPGKDKFADAADAIGIACWAAGVRLDILASH